MRGVHTWFGLPDVSPFARISVMHCPKTSLAPVTLSTQTATSNLSRDLRVVVHAKLGAERRLKPQTDFHCES